MFFRWIPDVVWISMVNGALKCTKRGMDLGNDSIAERVFWHLTKIGVGAFSQKIGWRRASAAHDLPRHYSEGSIFITRRLGMPWAAD